MSLESAENAELLALQRVDETSTKLQQQGKYLEALECMERGLVLRQHFFGADSEEVWKACKTVGEMCNLLAMTYLQQEDFPMVLELLKKAEILTERDAYGKAVTFNNLACYYRRQGKLHSALSYLQRAVRIEQRLDDVPNRADTHLNLCAVLSQLGRHAGALEHAQSALILLQEELFASNISNGSNEASITKADRIAVLAIAYHNIGVEQEFLKKFEMSMHSYKKGVEIGEQYLGENHGITVTLRNSYIAARRAVLSKNKSTPSTGRKLYSKTKNKKKPSVKSPTRKDEERWDSIQSAYGNIPGVPQIRMQRTNNAPSTSASEIETKQAESYQEAQEEEIYEEEPPQQEMQYEHNDLELHVAATTEPLTVDSKKEIMEMITPRLPPQEQQEELKHDHQGALEMFEKEPVAALESKQPEPEPEVAVEAAAEATELYQEAATVQESKQEETEAEAPVEVEVEAAESKLSEEAVESKQDDADADAKETELDQEAVEESKYSEGEAATVQESKQEEKEAEVATEAE